MDKSKTIQEYTPTEYFEYIKDKKKITNKESLKELYDTMMVLLEEYEATGQVNAAKKIIWRLEQIEKEQLLLDLNVNTFVYREDIEDYIDHVAKNTVKIIDLESYERSLPSEAVEAVKNTKSIFDSFYIIFTDYTGKEEKKVEKKRRDKDPILFGAFENESLNTMIGRLYFIADWVDEYCDLTLDKMVEEMRVAKKGEIRHTQERPKTLEELKVAIYNQQEAPRNANQFDSSSVDGISVGAMIKPPTLFNKIFTFLHINRRTKGRK